MKQVITSTILIFFYSSSFLFAQTHTSFNPHSRMGIERNMMRLDRNGEPHFSSSFLKTDSQKPSFSHQEPLVLKDYWDSLFYNDNSYDSVLDKGVVFTIASDGDNLYLGGSFEFFNDIRCYNVIAYNRKTGLWSGLGYGFNSSVNVLKVHDGKLYAGGGFTKDAYEITALRSIAVWDDTLKEWQEVGGGVDNDVTCIEFMDTSIIVGGSFTSAGGNTVSCIARWNGIDWDDMNGGIPNTVNTLLVVGDSLFAGGSFYTNGPLNEIALFSDGQWESVGEGLDGPVYSLAMVKGELWVGGDFSTTRSDAQQLYGLTRWNGSKWIPFASGSDTGLSGGVVYSITPMGDSIYIGGSFHTIAGVQAHSIVMWSNNTFTPIGNGVYGVVMSAVPYDGSLYIGGTFLNAGNLTVGNIAKIGVGNIWKSVTSGSGAYGGYTETFIEAVAATPQYVFIGGSFSTIAGKPFNNVAAWDKRNRKWIALGNGVDGEVRSLCVQGSNLYVGGSFNYAGGNTAQHIAYWDMNAQAWHSMGNGAVRFVSSIAANETGVYAAIYFPLVIGEGLNNYIGKWDGSKWNQIDGAIIGYVNAIAATGNTLYIGGVIYSIDGASFSNIAQYDGANWSSLDNGLSDRVMSIAIAGTDIYAAGYFGSAGNLGVKGIARWDGSAWNDLAGGLNAPARTLAWYGNTLYVGGQFTRMDNGLYADHIAKWDGNNWSAVTGGTDYSVYSLAVDGAGLYCGGGFTFVNKTFPSYRFAILHFASAGVEGLSLDDNDLQIYPNPFTTETKITFSSSESKAYQLEVFDLLGRKLYDGGRRIFEQGENQLLLPAASLPSGELFGRFSASDGTVKTIKLQHK